MILRWIEVKGWKCFAEAARVGPFREGLNVVHAPNASGKSTLFAALAHGLFDEHRVSGKDAETLRPWGRQLTPTVTIAFVHGGREYRLEKSFLDRPRAELARREDDRFVPLAEGESATRQVREMLCGTSPGRGMTRSIHWGLAQVLWAPQGKLAMAPLSADLAASIHQSLGAQVCGLGSGDVEARIEAAYQAHFTDKGQKLKRGKDASPVVALARQVESLEAERQALAEQLERFAEASREVEDLQLRREHAIRQRDHLAASLDGLERKQAAHEALVIERRTQEAVAQRAAATHQRLKERSQALVRAERERDEAAASLAGLETDAQVHLQQCHQRQQQASQALRVLGEIRARRAAIERSFEEAEAARRYVEAITRADQQQRLMAEVARVEAQWQQLCDERAAILAPDPETLQTLRKAARQRDDARLKLAAALTCLEIEALAPLAIRAVIAEAPGEHRLEAGQVLAIQGSPEVLAELPGVARIRAQGPSGSVDQLRKELARREAGFAELAARFASGDLDELERRHEAALAVNARRAEVKGQLDTLLAGRTLQELAQCLGQTQAVAEALRAERPHWAAAPPDAETLLSSAKCAKEAFMDEVDRAEEQQAAVQQALAAAQQQAARHDAQLHEARARLERAALAAAELRERCDEAALRTALEQAELEWSAAQTQLQRTAERLAAFDDDPAAALAQVARQHQALEAEVQRLADSRSRAVGRLETLASEAPYLRLAAVDEQLAAARGELARHQRHLEAVKLLRQTLDECRREAVAAVARPVEELATRMLERIAGARLGRVHLAETFDPCQVTPRGASHGSGGGVALEQLSGGEHEQVHLAVRLALGEVLARGRRELLVLDDVLTATDAARLARILSILDEAAQRLQILILTCHPERFAGLAEAHFVDLERLARAPGDGS